MVYITKQSINKKANCINLYTRIIKWVRKYLLIYRLLIIFNFVSRATSVVPWIAILVTNLNYYITNKDIQYYCLKKCSEKSHIEFIVWVMILHNNLLTTI